MSTFEIVCQVCGEMIPSASDELFVLSEGPDGIKEAAHRSCWFEEAGETDWEKFWARVEDRIDHEREDFHE